MTLDIWTSKNVLSFLVIRAHWISKDLQYNTQMLDFAPIDTHDGENQCRIFIECLTRFEIPLNKIVAYIMDNASSNDTFIYHLRKHGIAIRSDADLEIRCLAHILNLSVQDILNMIIGPENMEINESINIEEMSIVLTSITSSIHFDSYSIRSSVLPHSPSFLFVSKINFFVTGT